MPDHYLHPRAHLLASSQAPSFQYQVEPATADFSWNDYITRYVLTSGVLVANNTGAPFNDIFTKAGTNGTSAYAMFLFKNGVLQDAFMGGINSLDVPSYIEALGTLNHTTSPCGSLNYNFANTDSEPDILTAADGSWGFAKLSYMEELIFVFDAAGNCFDSVASKNFPTSIVLPVTMKSFSAKRQKGMVNLQWTTATESINKGSSVQRILGIYFNFPHLFPLYTHQKDLGIFIHD